MDVVEYHIQKNNIGDEEKRTKLTQVVQGRVERETVSYIPYMIYRSVSVYGYKVHDLNDNRDDLPNNNFNNF